MWLWLLMIAGVANSHAGTDHPTDAIPQSSVGPLSTAEAEILWKDGQAAFEKRRFEDTAYALQRLIDRYPGFVGTTRAHFLLGRARLELGQTRRAIPELKYFIAADSRSLDAARARGWLGRAYLDTQHANEAQLTATETVRQNDDLIKHQQAPFPADIVAQALLLKGEALIALGHDLRATQALTSAREVLAVPANALAPGAKTLQGQAAWIDLKLKLRACARYPGPGRLDEAQAREQMDRRGSCLLEAALLFRDTLKPGDADWADQASRDLSLAFRGYAKACKSPPKPPGPRSQGQLSRYRAELMQLLQADCQLRYTRAIELFQSWKGELTGPMAAHAQQLANTVAELKAPK